MQPTKQLWYSRGRWSAQKSMLPVYPLILQPRISGSEWRWWRDALDARGVFHDFLMREKLQAVLDNRLFSSSKNNVAARFLSSLQSTRDFLKFSQIILSEGSAKLEAKPCAFINCTNNRTETATPWTSTWHDLNGWAVETEIRKKNRLLSLMINLP